MRNEMAPVVFGDDPELLGMLTFPRTRASQRKGVVICPSFGHQGICSYRPLRTLAERITDKGFPVLRFDWPGSGDSGDADPTYAEALPLWIRAVSQASETLKGHTAVDEITLVGLRIGATIAVAAAGESNASELVLLAPFETGRTYVRELRLFQATSAERDVHESDTSMDGSIEASGFSIPEAEVRALEAIDLTAAAAACGDGRQRRVLVILPQRERSAEALAARLTEQRHTVEVRIRPELAYVWDGTNVSAMPRRVSRSICTWLEAGPSASKRNVAVRQEVGAKMSLEIAGVREEAVVLDTERGRRVAVTSTLLDGPVANDTWLVFLNAGRVRRTGPNRLWTALARRWAAEGLPSLRLDAHGAGDSDGERAIDEARHVRLSELYEPGIGADVSDALGWLSRTHGARRFALAGLCSGAFWAFQTAVAKDDVVCLVLVNPLTLSWDRRDTAVLAWEYGRHVATNPRSWRHALGRGAPHGLGEVAQGAALQLRGLGDRRWQTAEIKRSFDQLRARGTPTLAVYSAGDPSLSYLERHARSSPRDFLERYGVEVAIIDGADHTFRPLTSQQILRDAVEGHLRRVALLPAVKSGAS